MINPNRISNTEIDTNQMKEKNKVVKARVEKINSHLSNPLLWVLGTLFTAFIMQIVFVIIRAIDLNYLKTKEIRDLTSNSAPSHFHKDQNVNETNDNNQTLQILQKTSGIDQQVPRKTAESKTVAQKPPVIDPKISTQVRLATQPTTQPTPKVTPNVIPKMEQSVVKPKTNVTQLEGTSGVASLGLWANAEKLIEHMKRVVDWAKSSEGLNELAQAKHMLLSEYFCISNILPNLDLGGSGCLRGIVNHGNEPMGKREGVTPSEGVKGKVKAAYDLFGLTSDQLPNLEEMDQRFKPYVAFEGNGIYGYVYSTNGNGERVSPGAEVNFDGNLKPSSTVNVYLKPNYLSAEEKSARFINGTLFFNFGPNQEVANYTDLLTSIDNAVDILHLQDKSSQPEPMIVHCSSGAERSVTTAIAIILRNIQRQGVEITEELVNLTTSFLQARRAGASDFKDGDNVIENESFRSVLHMRNLLIDYLIKNPLLKE